MTVAVLPTSNRTSISPPPRSRRPLHTTPLNITRHPPAIKIPRLRLHPLPIDETLPRARVEAQKPFDLLEAFGRTVVAPDAIPHDFATVLNGVVRRLAFPLAVRTAGGFLEGDFEG